MPDSLLDQIAAIEQDNREVDEKVDDTIRKQRAKDQSRIAWVIIWAFVGALFLVFVVVILHLLMDESGQENGADESWEAPAKFLLSAVSSVLLPVVTLVLGYYFGKEKSK